MKKFRSCRAIVQVCICAFERRLSIIPALNICLISSSVNNSETLLLPSF